MNITELDEINSFVVNDSYYTNTEDRLNYSMIKQTKCHEPIQCHVTGNIESDQYLQKFGLVFFNNNQNKGQIDNSSIDICQREQQQNIYTLNQQNMQKNDTLEIMIPQLSKLFLKIDLFKTTLKHAVRQIFRNYPQYDFQQLATQIDSINIEFKTMIAQTRDDKLIKGTSSGNKDHEYSGIKTIQQTSTKSTRNQIPQFNQHNNSQSPYDISIKKTKKNDDNDEDGRNIEFKKNIKNSFLSLNVVPSNILLQQLYRHYMLQQKQLNLSDDQLNQLKKKGYFTNIKNTIRNTIKKDINIDYQEIKFDINILDKQQIKDILSGQVQDNLLKKLLQINISGNDKRNLFSSPTLKIDNQQKSDDKQNNEQKTQNEIFQMDNEWV